MENRAIGMYLRRVNNAVRRWIDRNTELKTRMDEIKHLTCSNGWIIAHLYEMESQGKPVYQRDFEKEFGITRSTASKVLTLLEKKGLLKRTQAEHDGRMKKIELTDTSREMSREIGERTNEMENQLRSGFSEIELEMLYGFLDRMMENLEDSESKANSDTTKNKRRDTR